MFWNHNLFLLILILLLSFAGRAEKPDVEFDMFLETMFDAFSDSLYDAAAKVGNVVSLLEEHILQWRFVEVQLLEPNININMPEISIPLKHLAISQELLGKFYCVQNNMREAIFWLERACPLTELLPDQDSKTAEKCFDLLRSAYRYVKNGFDNDFDGVEISVDSVAALKFLSSEVDNNVARKTNLDNSEYEEMDLEIFNNENFDIEERIRDIRAVYDHLRSSKQREPSKSESRQLKQFLGNMDAIDIVGVKLDPSAYDILSLSSFIDRSEFNNFVSIRWLIGLFVTGSDQHRRMILERVEKLVELVKSQYVMNFDDDVMELKFDICVFVIEIMNECLANGLSYITNEMEKYSSDSSFLDSDSKSSSLYELRKSVLMGFVDALDHVKSDGEQNATPFGMDNNKVLFDSAKPKRDKRKKTDRPKPVDLEIPETIGIQSKVVATGSDGTSIVPFVTISLIFVTAIVIYIFSDPKIREIWLYAFQGNFGLSISPTDKIEHPGGSVVNNNNNNSNVITSSSSKNKKVSPMAKDKQGKQGTKNSTSVAVKSNPTNSSAQSVTVEPIPVVESSVSIEKTTNKLMESAPSMENESSSHGLKDINNINSSTNSLFGTGSNSGASSNSETIGNCSIKNNSNNMNGSDGDNCDGCNDERNENSNHSNTINDNNRAHYGCDNGSGSGSVNVIATTDASLLEQPKKSVGKISEVPDSRVSIIDNVKVEKLEAARSDSDFVKSSKVKESKSDGSRNSKKSDRKTSAEIRTNSKISPNSSLGEFKSVKESKFPDVSVKKVGNTSTASTSSFSTASVPVSRVTVEDSFQPFVPTYILDATGQKSFPLGESNSSKLDFEISSSSFSLSSRSVPSSSGSEPNLSYDLTRSLDSIETSSAGYHSSFSYPLSTFASPNTNLSNRPVILSNGFELSADAREFTPQFQSNGPSDAITMPPLLPCSSLYDAPQIQFDFLNGCDDFLTHYPGSTSTSYPSSSMGIGHDYCSTSMLTESSSSLGSALGSCLGPSTIVGASPVRPTLSINFTVFWNFSSMDIISVKVLSASFNEWTWSDGRVLKRSIGNPTLWGGTVTLCPDSQWFHYKFVAEDCRGRIWEDSNPMRTFTIDADVSFHNLIEIEIENVVDNAISYV